MDRHLVAVEIRVECGADQWVQPNGLAFHQHGIKRLDTETVQRRCTVQQHRMFTNHLVKDIPYLRPFFFDQSFSTLDRRRSTPLLQLMEDKGLEEFERHLLGQSTLMQPKFRSHHNDGSARIIDPFTEQVLPKAALLSL